MKIRSKLVVILGPTASGKSDLAVRLAHKFKGEIISADSRQVYRGMDIGTGKVPQDNGKIKNIKNTYIHNGIKHHLIDIASPKKTFTVAEYQKKARKAVKDILQRGKTPIVCGGTGFYIDALVYQYPIPAVPPQKSLRKKFETETTEELITRLKNLDPIRAKTIDSKNKRRIIRALEIIITTGKPVPLLLNEKRIEIYNTLKIGISIPKELLNKRIVTRLNKRIKEGMEKEVKRLHKEGVSWKRLDEFGLEYRYIASYLQKKINKVTMVETLAKEIKLYAKRQMTWFKKDKKIHWVKNYKEAEKITSAFLEY